MPRPPSARTASLKTYSLYLTTAEEAEAARLARDLQALGYPVTNEKGESSRSALFRFMVAELRKRADQEAAQAKDRKRLAKAAKKSGKTEKVGR